MKMKLFLTTAIFMMGMVGRIQAQELEGRVNMQQVLTYALANSPELGRLEAEWSGLKGNRLSEIGINNPTVSYAREGIPKQEGGFGEQRVVIQQSFRSPLSMVHGLKQNSALVQASHFRMADTRLKVREKVKLAYLELLFTQQLEDLRREAVDLVDSILVAIAGRIEAGDAAELDHLRAELDLASAHSDLEQAMRMKQRACYGLYQSLNIPAPEGYCALEASETLLDVEPAPDFAGTLRNHPALQIQQAAVDAARYGLRKVQGAAFPRFHFNYWPQDFGNGYDFRGFEIGMSIPVFSIFNERGNRKMAESEVQQRYWDLEESQAFLQGEWQKAIASYRVSRAAQERFGSEVVGQADRTLALTQRAYALGEVDLLTLLDTRRMYVNIRARGLDVRREYTKDLIRMEYFLQQPFVWE